MFFNRYLKPFLVIGGMVTMYAGIYAINPESALREMNNLPYDSSYVFLFRHWGIMVGLMGALLQHPLLSPSGESQSSSIHF